MVIHSETSAYEGIPFSRDITAYLSNGKSLVIKVAFQDLVIARSRQKKSLG